MAHRGGKRRHALPADKRRGRHRCLGTYYCAGMGPELGRSLADRSSRDAAQPSVDSPEEKGVKPDMFVIAVDPAPGRKSTVFDGTNYFKMSGRELRVYLAEPRNRTQETLLCWDAPLTGPGSPASAGKSPSDFTQRRIEQFFSRNETGFKTPKGISVLPYSGCPHWTITRSLLGLPRTGPYDVEYHGLPYHLLPGPGSERGGRASVVEVHPAVAAWLWCRGAKGECWEYKKDIGILNEMWSIILSRIRFRWADRPTPGDDDEFDASVGYLLGSLYHGERNDVAEGERDVVILGDRVTGSFLLPVVPGLESGWRAWINCS